ncbi:MAG: type III pantothenate kinase [Bdellovibrionales bacterium]|nr:type III pantothenate kinase [Bdellovibrionales bacterium]
MFLALDIGNSETTIGVFDETALIAQWRLETGAARSADQIAAFLYPLFQHHKIDGPWTGMAICSVVPTARRGLREFAQRYLGLEAFEVTPRIKLPFALNVQEPESVGADRLANAAYAAVHLSLPSIIVDCGTATTLDVITPGGGYEGGVILPGVGLSFESLSRKTSQLSLVESEFPRRVIGKSTKECIQAGILYGYCDQINGLLKRTQEEIGKPCTTVLTGGYASIFEGRIPGAQFSPTLTLEGIQLLYQFNF